MVEPVILGVGINEIESEWKKRLILKNFPENSWLFVDNQDGLLRKDISFDKVQILASSIYQPLSKATLGRFSQLRAINVLGTSTRQIDTEYCQAHDIKIRNVKEYCDKETGEWVIGQLINFFRGLGEFSDRTPQSVVGKTLGLIGVGAVGSHVLRVAEALQMKVLYHARTKKPEFCSASFARIEEIFSQSDAISFHTPPYTYWLCAHHLSLLKPHALLINTVMGRVNEENVLERFLQDREDISIVMDKIAIKNYPLVSGRARGVHQCAYLTPESICRLHEQFFDNLFSVISEINSKNL